MCLYPKLIKNRKYIANKKNGGNIPAVSDKRVLLVPVGCGKCIECKKQKSREWSVRLMEEIRHDKNGRFITLTFSQESIMKLIEERNVDVQGYERDNELARIGIRRFLERWRKKYGKSVKHWFVTELGKGATEHMHLHGILFTDKKIEEIRERWEYGHIYESEDNKGQKYVNEKTINYIVKYINKVDELHKEYNSRIFTSKGIGKEYINRVDAKNNKYNGTNTDESYKTRQGVKLALTIYHRNKIYSEEEREKLWLHKLDKMERWVCGERVDISKGEEKYYELLEYHRERNKKLGYGTNEKNWSLKRYENERRNLIHKERIKKMTNKEIIKPSENNDEIKIPMMDSKDDIW